MPKLKPSDIVDNVATVLMNCSRGKGTQPTFMTAYQILARFPRDLRLRLVRERGGIGIGGGAHYGAATVVAKAGELLAKRGQAVIAYMDTGGLKIVIDRRQIDPSYEVCGIYSARP